MQEVGHAGRVPRQSREDARSAGWLIGTSRALSAIALAKAGQSCKSLRFAVWRYALSDKSFLLFFMWNLRDRNYIYGSYSF